MPSLTYLRLSRCSCQSYAESVLSLRNVVAGRLACGVVLAALFYFVKGDGLPVEHLFRWATCCLCLLSSSATGRASLEENKGPPTEKAENAKKPVAVELLWSTS